jgi:DNA end-binding protein Ku
MAEALIDSLSDEQLDPGRYRDVHRETLTALIDAKATGQTVTQDGGPGVASVDLLAALRASIEAAKQRRSTADNGGRRRTATSAGAARKKQKKSAQPERGANVPKKRS